MSIFTKWITHDFVPAFCRMLLHSLWLSLVAALLAGIIIAATNKISASARYTCLVLLFTILIAATGISFFIELKSSPDFSTTTTSLPSFFETGAVDFSQTDITSTKEHTWFISLISFLDKNSLVIASLWFFVFLFKIMKMIFGLRHIHTIRHQKVHSTGKNWVQWVKQKSEELGIKKIIVLLQSELVKVPVTIGHLKPVILIPLGLLSQLSPQQVESILIHELAHIRRKDYLVNLLQSITDVIFFFNPAFLWLSSLIRQEREKCCDDIVIQHSSHTDYLEALVFFQDTQYRDQYSMALVTRKDSLYNRVKLILTKENSNLTLGETSFLLLGTLIIGIGFMAFKQRTDYPVIPRLRIESGKKPDFSIGHRQTHSIFFADKSILEIIKDSVPSKKPAAETKQLQELGENISDKANLGNNINDTVWVPAVNALLSEKAKQPDIAVAAVQKREAVQPGSSGKNLASSHQKVKAVIKPLKPAEKKRLVKPVIPTINSE